MVFKRLNVLIFFLIDSICFVSANCCENSCKQKLKEIQITLAPLKSAVLDESTGICIEIVNPRSNLEVLSQNIHVLNHKRMYIVTKCIYKNLKGLVVFEVRDGDINNEEIVNYASYLSSSYKNPSSTSDKTLVQFDPKNLFVKSENDKSKYKISESVEEDFYKLVIDGTKKSSFIMVSHLTGYLKLGKEGGYKGDDFINCFIDNDPKHNKTLTVLVNENSIQKKN